MSSTWHFHPTHVLQREVEVTTKKGEKKKVSCPVSDTQGFLLVSGIEEKLSNEWSGMIRSSKDFQSKEKYRFFDSSKYKPLIRKGLPFSRRPEMWKRLCNPGIASLKTIVFEDVWRRAFRWENLKPPAMVTTATEEAKRSVTKTDPSFIPLFPPCFGSTSYAVFQRLPVLFSLSESGVTNLRYLLCLLSEANPEVRICPLLPGLMAGLLTQLSVQEVFDAAHGLMYLSKDTHLVETRVQYLRLSTVTYDATIRSMIHFIQGKVPQTVSLLKELGVDLKVIIHHLFSEFFVNMLPMCISLRIIDVFLNEGEKVLYRVGLALFTKIIPNELKAIPETKDDFDQFFSRFKVTDAAQVNTIFVTAFDYSFSRETSKAVEARYTKPDEVLQMLYPNPSQMQELRSRPEVSPGSGGDILTTPTSWEPIFGFLYSPKLYEAAFMPTRVERIFSTGQHGWNLATMYRQCAESLAPFPKQGYNVRGLLLVKGTRANPDAPEGTFKNGEEVIIGACLHPLPDGKSYSAGGNNKYAGAAGTFVFGILPHDEQAAINAAREAYDGDNKAPVVTGTMKMTHNTVQYSKYDRDYSCYYHYVGEPLEELSTPQRKVKFGEKNNQVHEPATSSGTTEKVGEAGSTTCSPLHSNNHSMTSLNGDKGDDADRGTSFEKEIEIVEEEQVGEEKKEEEVSSGATGGLNRVQSVNREDQEDHDGAYEEGNHHHHEGEEETPGDEAPPVLPLRELENTSSLYSGPNTPAEEAPSATPPQRRSSLKGALGSTNKLKRFPNTKDPEAKDRLVVETEEKPVNNYFWMMEPDKLTVGGGRNGGAALRLSDDLHRLESMQCQTFDCPSLLQSAVEKEGANAGAGCHLEVLSVELWAILE